MAVISGASSCRAQLVAGTPGSSRVMAAGRLLSAYLAWHAGSASKGVAMSSKGRRRTWRLWWLSAIRWPAIPKLAVGLVGVGLLALGAVKFGTAAGDEGAITLVVAGGVLLVSPLLADRIERVSVSPSGVDLWLVTQVSSRGAPETARVLQRTDLGSFAEAYALVHAELRGDDYRRARIHLQDLLVDRASAASAREKFDAWEVRALFGNGSPVVRVLALGLMQGDRSLADIATITGAIAQGRSPNEQYQALRLADLYWTNLSQRDRQDIRHAIEQADLGQDTSRQRLAQRLLAQPPE